MAKNKQGLLSQRMSASAKQETDKPQVPKKKKTSKTQFFQSTPKPVDTTPSEPQEFSPIENNEEQQAKLSKIKTISLLALLIGLCVYMCFLIYGVILTRYVYDNNGVQYPEVLSVHELQELKEYETMSSYYLRARVLYEDVLKLDYELSVYPDRSLTIAMDYTKILETVDKLAQDLNAAEYDSRYSAIYQQLQIWTATDMGVYLQKIATALTYNDATTANEALTVRNVLYNDFATITANIATIADSTKGADNQKIYDWTPEDFMQALK